MAATALRPPACFCSSSSSQRASTASTTTTTPTITTWLAFIPRRNRQPSSHAAVKTKSRGDVGPADLGRWTARRRKAGTTVAMTPDDEKMTRRSPLDFPVEWERPTPGRRPDIFPQFSPMKTPLPTPSPSDPPEEDEDEEEKKEEDPDKEDKPEE